MQQDSQRAPIHKHDPVDSSAAITTTTLSLIATMIKTSLSNATFRRAIAGRRLLSAAPLISDASAECIDLEDRYGAHNYHPLPVVLAKGKGAACSHGMNPLKMHPIH